MVRVWVARNLERLRRLLGVFRLLMLVRRLHHRRVEQRHLVLDLLQFVVMRRRLVRRLVRFLVVFVRLRADFLVDRVHSVDLRVRLVRRYVLFLRLRELRYLLELGLLRHGSDLRQARF